MCWIGTSTHRIEPLIGRIEARHLLIGLLLKCVSQAGNACQAFTVGLFLQNTYHLISFNMYHENWPGLFIVKNQRLTVSKFVGVSKTIPRHQSSYSQKMILGVQSPQHARVHDPFSEGQPGSLEHPRKFPIWFGPLTIVELFPWGSSCYAAGHKDHFSPDKSMTSMCLGAKPRPGGKTEFWKPLEFEFFWRMAEMMYIYIYRRWRG